MNKILLLDDLPEIRSWLKALALQVFPNAQVSEAARVHDALALVSAERFEVALIDPEGPNELKNALPLRADLRTLFDLNLLRVHPKTRKVFLAESVQTGTYARLWARTLRPPESKDSNPDFAALTRRWNSAK